MIRSRTVLALALSGLLVAAGCSAGREEPGSPFDGTRGSQDVLLTVENNDFYDANIHLSWGGMRTRAGTVTGKTTETFRLTWKHEWAQIEVDFVGSNSDYRSERVSVFPGDHLNFVIMAGLSAR